MPPSVHLHLRCGAAASAGVNSQALELGIERPKLRRGSAIANQNTLIYVLINLHALQRVRERKPSSPARR